MKRFLLAILSISVLSVNPIISCNDRIIYYGNNTDIATEDGSGDTGIHNELPDDICPERYTENNLELFPAPKNIFGTDRRIEVKNFEFITDGNKDIDDFFKNSPVFTEIPKKNTRRYNEFENIHIFRNQRFIRKVQNITNRKTRFILSENYKGVKWCGNLHSGRRKGGISQRGKDDSPSSLQTESH